jgi:hypothetical protein
MSAGNSVHQPKRHDKLVAARLFGRQVPQRLNVALCQHEAAKYFAERQALCKIKLKPRDTIPKPAAYAFRLRRKRPPPSHHGHTIRPTVVGLAGYWWTLAGTDTHHLAPNGHHSHTGTHQHTPRSHLTTTYAHQHPSSVHVMNPDHKAFLDQLPDKPDRSKLAPYSDLIRSLRQKRYTFREIAYLLATRYALKVNHTTIVDFTKRRLNQPQLQADSTDQHHRSSTPKPPPIETASLHASAPQLPLSRQAPNSAYKRFHYDPEEGLTLSDKDLNLKPRKD